MKKLLVILSLAACISTQAQTNATPSLGIPTLLDALTNIPVVTNFTQAKFGVDTGATIKAGSLENYFKISTYIHTNFIVAAEIQNAPVASVVDSGSFYLGYRKAWANADVYALAGVRKNWTDINNHTQGLVGVGASYIPMTGGYMPITCELLVPTSPTGNPLKTAPQLEIRVGTSLKF
jgi:hypothetical protein